MHSAVLLFLFCFFPSMHETSFYSNHSQSQEKSHPEFGHFILNVLCDVLSDDWKIDLRLRIHPDPIHGFWYGLKVLQGERGAELSLPSLEYVYLSVEKDTCMVYNLLNE